MTTKVKTAEQYFPVVLLTMLYKVLTVKTVDGNMSENILAIHSICAV